MSDVQFDRFSRRDVLRVAGLGLTGAALAAIGGVAAAPERAWADDGSGAAIAPPSTKPDIQYAIGAFTPPAISYKGIPFELGGPVYTLFVTAKFTRPLTAGDQAEMARILDTIDGGPNRMGNAYPFSPAGVFPIVSYGLPYFAKVTALAARQGKPDPVAANMPLDTGTHQRALVEAIPAPTDVSPGNEPVAGRRFNLAVTIEDNDLLFSFRSDNQNNLRDVERWVFEGSNRVGGRIVPSPTLLQRTSSRLMFVQVGLPRKMATALSLPFAAAIPVDSPMWFGIADQNVNGAGPPEITTFAGNKSAVLTTAKPGDYFDNATIQTFSHNVSDLAGWYATAGTSSDFDRRLQLMFRATHAFGNGGGTPFWDNRYYGPGDATQGAAGIGTPGRVRRIGHLAALQRTSRAADGTPLHARMDGPGYSGMDTGGAYGADGPAQPTLEFSMFGPTGDFINNLRRSQSSPDLVKRYGVKSTDNGLESFITSTRRQNFLSPPRRNRALPLIELT